MTFKDCETKEQILEKYKSTKKLNVKESKATEDVKTLDSPEYLITAPLEVRKVLSMDEATLQQSLNSADMNMQKPGWIRVFAFLRHYAKKFADCGVAHRSGKGPDTCRGLAGSRSAAYEP